MEHRLTPRISANKLGEYTVATPARRRTIVRDQRFPSEFITLRYDRARSAITNFFLSGHDSGGLLRTLQDLTDATPRSEWDEDDRRLSAEALQHFLGAATECNFDGLSPSAGENDPPKLLMESVDVSVRPEIILRGLYRGKPVVGALKLHFGKTSALDKDAALNIATLVHQYVERHLLGPEEAASFRHCVVVDVFGEQLHRAPQAYRARRATLEAACQEIALWWHHVSDHRKPRPAGERSRRV